jgi:hypothetical protein
MKKNYQKIEQEYWFSFRRNRWIELYNTNSLGRYSHKYSYCRSVHTQNERKQNCWAQDDGHHVRGKRRYKHLIDAYDVPIDAYDDPMIGRTWKRSWKDFTKCKKQYMVNIK